MSGALVERLRAARRILLLTGAGVSAESGLATFRGPDGMWEGRDPMSLATPEAFAEDPETVWRFYAWRREQAARAEPNPAHRAIAALQQERSGTSLVTQNVDGLHERAGSPETVRLHGSLWRLRCTGGCGEDEDLRQDLGTLPARCACGELLRPGVVWFGESLPQAAIAAATAAAESAELVIVAGTSSVVYPAAALPELARRHGAYVVEVNPEATPLTGRVDEALPNPAGTALPALVRAAGVRFEES
ncbi:hypothetical protein ABI59_05765 [Acidobacteria bacterium Mor1]|nr:hypothetical protein ABI59_05765 [Acidobacteria bacterium Mor1]